MSQDWLLKQAIEKSGKSKKELASLCEISLQQLTNVINGKWRLNFEQQVLLGKVIKLDPYLFDDTELLNSLRDNNSWRCNSRRPCKVCITCIGNRANALLSEAPQKFVELGINRHVVIRYEHDHRSNNSHRELKMGADGLVKNVHRYIKPFVRFNAIGRLAALPHSHYCLRDDKIRYLKEYTTDIRFMSGAAYSCKNGGVIENPYRLLAYLFYKNFVPTFLDNRRVKRFRLITGTRFMSWGHPTNQKENRYGKQGDGYEH